ncbi:MAG: DUF5329 domain-containing protein [Steroidobacteraceae bacterium]
MFLSLAIAAPSAEVQAEVSYLLQSIENSGCEFHRNGLWYDGTHASTHLRNKYEYFVARDQVSTTENFIDRAATKSSISGILYKIRCTGGAPVNSNVWLREALAAYRQAKVALPAR